MQQAVTDTKLEISIHAPLAGCDCAIDLLSYATLEFQSTHPSRGATPKVDLAASPFPFQSTHPLRGATLVVAV